MKSDAVDLSNPCKHVTAETPHHAKRPTPGCEDCLKIGGQWVHLRACRTCGHVACCDSSPNQHASKHAAASSHPVVTSAEPGEQWLYCFVDDAFVEY